MITPDSEERETECAFWRGIVLGLGIIACWGACAGAVVLIWGS